MQIVQFDNLNYGKINVCHEQIKVFLWTFIDAVSTQNQPLSFPFLKLILFLSLQAKNIIEFALNCY